MMMKACENCGALVPGPLGTDAAGRRVCCVACVFHPEGCRCGVGDFGVAEETVYEGCSPRSGRTEGTTGTEGTEGTRAPGEGTRPTEKEVNYAVC